MDLVEKQILNHHKSIDEINTAMIKHAQQITQEIGATKVLVYIDVIKSPNTLKNLLKESLRKK